MSFAYSNCSAEIYSRANCKMYFPIGKFLTQLKTYIRKFSAQLKTYSYSSNRRKLISTYYWELSAGFRRNSLTVVRLNVSFFVETFCVIMIYVRAGSVIWLWFKIIIDNSWEMSFSPSVCLKRKKHGKGKLEIVNNSARVGNKRSAQDERGIFFEDKGSPSRAS